MLRMATTVMRAGFAMAVVGVITLEAGGGA
jgi:hypothetical protein